MASLEARVAGVDAVEQQAVKMGREIERAAEELRHDERGALQLGARVDLLALPAEDLLPLPLHTRRRVVRVHDGVPLPHAPNAVDRNLRPLCHVRDLEPGSQQHLSSVRGACRPGRANGSRSASATP